MEFLTLSFVLAFILSIAFNLYQTLALTRLKQQVSDRDDLIDDLRSAIGGAPKHEAWREDTL